MSREQGGGRSDVVRCLRAVWWKGRLFGVDCTDPLLRQLAERIAEGKKKHPPPSFFAEWNRAASCNTTEHVRCFYCFKTAEEVLEAIGAGDAEDDPNEQEREPEEQENKGEKEPPASRAGAVFVMAYFPPEDLSGKELMEERIDFDAIAARVMLRFIAETAEIIRQRTLLERDEDYYCYDYDDRPEPGCCESCCAALCSLCVCGGAAGAPRKMRQPEKKGLKTGAQKMAKQKWRRAEEEEEERAAPPPVAFAYIPPPPEAGAAPPPAMRVGAAAAVPFEPGRPKRGVMKVEGEEAKIHRGREEMMMADEELRSRSEPISEVSSPPTADIVPPGKAEEEKEKEEEEEERKKTDEEEIDELFADLETVVKYTGKALFWGTRWGKGYEDISTWCLQSLWFVVRASLTVLLGFVVVVAVLLPTFFAVLIVRMTKVEVSRESFVRRAAIIAQETILKHTARIVRLFARSLPLSLLIIVVPPVAFAAVLPHLPEKATRDVAFWVIAVFVASILALQVMGTTRAVITFRASEAARDRTRSAAALVIQKWWRKTQTPRRITRSVLSVVPLNVPINYNFRLFPPLHAATVAQLTLPSLPLLGDFLKFGSLCVPTTSLALLRRARMSLPTPPSLSSLTLPIKLRRMKLPSAQWLRNIAFYATCFVETVQLSLLSFRALPRLPDVWVDVTLLPALFGSFDVPNFAFAWVAIGAVALLLTVVAGRMMYEMRQYEAMLAERDDDLSIESEAQNEESAEAFFFHSFVGSVLYGHGNPKGVPALLCTLVAFGCDLLFLTIISNLGSVLTCFPSDDDGDFVAGSGGQFCWARYHRATVACALISFGFYVPLSIMVAPVLAEANKVASSGTIAVSKPFLMILNVGKAGIAMFLVLVSFRSLASIISVCLLCSFMLLLSSVWAARCEWKQPASTLDANVSRLSAAVSATVCAATALLLFIVPSLSGPHQYTFVLCVVVVCGVVVPLVAPFTH